MSINFQHPLKWPEGWPRNETHRESKFQVDQDRAIKEMESEIEMLGGELIILTSELVLRKDGRPVKDQRVADPGVAVYYQRQEEPQVMACDRYWEPRDNIRAIGLTIAALRGIERWGGLNIMNRAFEGFKALQAPGQQPQEPAWHEVLAVPSTASDYDIKHARNQLARKYHPDIGTDPDDEMMARINRAYDAARGRG